MTLRDIREKAGRSLRQVAAEVGVSHVCLGEIERGIRPLPDRLRPLIARALGVPEEEVSGRAPERVSLAGMTEEQRAEVAAFVARLRGRVAA